MTYIHKYTRQVLCGKKVPYFTHIDLSLVLFFKLKVLIFISLMNLVQLLLIVLNSTDVFTTVT